VVDPTQVVVLDPERPGRAVTSEDDMHIACGFTANSRFATGKDSSVASPFTLGLARAL
jgi:hypothetical protein